MTNKSEMVLAPREMLEKLLTVAALSASAPYRELRAPLDAPAEDVRAVGEEPVYLFTDEQGMPGWTDRWDVAKHLPYDVEKVYRRPHRPVVLPERFERLHVSEYRAGWNACIDEFERLNK